MNILAGSVSFELAQSRFPDEFPSTKRQRWTSETLSFPSLTFRAMKNRNFDGGGGISVATFA